MKHREYIEQKAEFPLVTRFGVARLEITGKNSAYLRCHGGLNIESAVFSGLVYLRRSGVEWVAEVHFYDGSSVTPRREQLLLKGIVRAMKNIPENRFVRFERVRLNNEIIVLDERINNAKKDMEKLLAQEQELITANQA